MRIDVCLCCGMAMLLYIRQYAHTAICIYGLPCGQIFIGWPFICRPPKMGSLPPFLFLMAHVLSRWKRSLVAELSSWSLLLSLVPSCPHLTLLSLFVLFRQGYSWPKFQGLLSVVSFSIFPTRHMFSWCLKGAAFYVRVSILSCTFHFNHPSRS